LIFVGEGGFEPTFSTCQITVLNLIRIGWYSPILICGDEGK